MGSWLTGAGTFWILGVSWGGFGFFYFMVALRLGKAARSDVDGWLLGLCCLLFVLMGGLIGLLLLRYPFTILSSMVGALLLPGLVTFAYVKRTHLDKRS